MNEGPHLCFNVGAIEWHIYACIENLDAFQLARLVAHNFT